MAYVAVTSPRWIRAVNQVGLATGLLVGALVMGAGSGVVAVGSGGEPS